ncbi:MAG: hypothetical protein IKE18_00120 [Oscillospiraceae bacterium]|nr:hypothetical protein [Oscillospiraceae bacterium]
MDDIIKDENARYEEYENLLVDKDELIKEGESIWVHYQQLFGQLITDIFEEKLECIKNKKVISLYQAAINHGGHVFSHMVDEYLDKEMSDYYAELQRLISEKDSAEDAATVSAYASKRSKELYRRLAKLLHPDINPLTDESEELQDLWVRTVKAYEEYDVKTLSELEVLVRKTLKELGAGEIKVEIPDIREKIDALKEEIMHIRASEPYCHKALIENPEAVEKKTKELEEELQKYKDYYQELNRIILEMLNGGDLIIHVD